MNSISLKVRELFIEHATLEEAWSCCCGDGFYEEGQAATSLRRSHLQEILRHFGGQGEVPPRILSLIQTC